MPLDLLQAELQLARLRNEPPVAVQNAMDYERVRLDILRLKAELATAKVNLERGENDTRRSKRLYEEKVLSEDLYDLSAKTRDAVKAEVVEKADAVSQMEKRLEELRAMGDPQSGVDDEHLRALLARLQNAQACAASNWGPITLVAPITGMISAINRRAGEYILDGEPIVGIASPWSDRVVTYLRQPYPLDPEVGMKVRLTTRTDTRQQFWASVTHIGAQVEVITNALTFVRQGALVDVGLPVVIDLPRHTRIRPGEILDLWIERRPASPPPNQL
jgi:multidrug resistance efflux pump